MSSLMSAGILLALNLGLLWLLMAAPLGLRTITFRRRYKADRDMLWQAVHPLGRHADWSPSILTSMADGAPSRVRQTLTYPDRKGQPIVRVLDVSEVPSPEAERAYRATIVEDSALDRSYWRNFSETRQISASPGGADLTISVTDRYRGLAMYLFRYFAMRRELRQLDQWIRTGMARTGGLFEHPLTQIVSALGSTLVLWPFLGLTPMGLLLSCLLTAVIVLHEVGHIIAYRAFGHKSARMIFVPLLGGLAIGGRPYNSLFEVATCALMGPGMSAFLVPIGIAVYDLAQSGFLPAVTAKPALLFLLILGSFNLLNLLPMSRFDGGQVLRQVFPSRPVQIAASFGITAIILLIGWRIGVPLAGLEAALAVFTLMSLIGTARVKPREALDPMSPGERLAAGFGLYAAVAIHGYAIVTAADVLFP